MNQFPQMAMNNRNIVEQSKKAGCFCCVKIFDVKDIKEYTDNGKTVICPLCGVDTVIGDMCGFDLNESTLKKANVFWFGKRN
jgi:hypothetical protein